MDEDSIKPRRIPQEANGIQVNFCKNPACGNFGVPASTEIQPRGRGKRQDVYTITGSSDGQFLKCHKCNEYPPIKSNQGIHEEFQRISAYLESDESPSCPNEDCDNHYIPLRWDIHKEHYCRYGTTKKGSLRYRCNDCKKVFTVPSNGSSPVENHSKSHLNALIFKILMRKMSITCVADAVSVSPSTVYDKIDFLHRQCLAFAANRERDIPDMHFDRLYIAVDRQEQIVNWTNRKARKNVTLQAIGSADCQSRYVFGMHVNYDRSLNVDKVREDALNCGDYEAQPAMRKYARVWLPEEYTGKATGNKPVLDESEDLLSIDEKIRSRYEAAAARDDVEAGDPPSKHTRTPPEGMMVRPEYTLYAHFLFLKRLFKNVDKVRFYTDQESGIRAACLAAFWEEVLDKRCDMFYVSIKKNYTIDDKNSMVQQGKRRLKEFKHTHPEYAELYDNDIRHMMIVEQIRNMREFGKWNDKWMEYPFPTMDEPEKKLCYLTNLRDKGFDYDESHLARLFMKGSLRAIDQFFMQTRRRASGMERPLSSSANRGRKWYLYNFYNPYNLIKILDIYRVFYNYCKKGTDKKTPAMRLGLAKGPCKVEDIIYFAETMEHPGKEENAGSLPIDYSI
jgi:transposase-like protein